jgi:hypothetical protein
MMLYTTWNLAKKHNACERALTSWKKHLGKKPDGDTLIPLTDILDTLGLDDALWALRATTEDSKMFSVKFAIACADRVLIIFESKYPGDKRPREAIEAAQAFLLNPSKKTADAAADAAHAAHAAAYATADAAADAAHAAAYAAERKWQTEKFRELLSE